ncbi:MAG TPA: PAS domain-containing sensor histidine kinase [Acidimicrobiales bacterium]|nr:PAS domain-containing sensor histidine kinase [Acidimicrobiales bacterium]
MAGAVAPSWTARPPTDAAPVRIAAGARIVLAVVLGAVGSFVPGLRGRSDAFYLLVELVYLPYVTALFFASARPGNKLVLVGGPFGDLSLLFALQVLVAGAGGAALVGYLVVVTFAVFTVGRRTAAVFAAQAIVLTLVAQLLVPESRRLSALDLLPYSVAVLALLFMIDRSATRQAAFEAQAARLRSRADTILAHVADAVLVMDDAGTVLQCNEAVVRVFGQPQADVVERPCASVLALHNGERILDCSKGCALLALGHADGALDVEVWRTASDGRRQPLLASVSQVAGEDGSVQTIHSVRDLTRIKQAEEAKNLFLATASHELKTPLTVIQGFADTLVQYPELDEPTKAAALRAIRTRCGELARIVDRLLMSSRIEAGRIQLTIRAFDLVPLLRERVTAMAAATGRQVAFEADADAHLVEANPEALVTVVDHLLDNALKYSPDGDPVTVSVHAAGGEVVAVDVADRGIGMDPEQVAHCFDKFWQAESSDVRRFGGTGIGLYIVRSLVEGMNGAVQVRSQKGSGSVFTVELGLRREREAEPGVGEQTSIREFMRHIGVAPGRRP